jgi:hypothetical protein
MIGDPLAFAISDRGDCTGFIVPAQRLTMIVPEIEFRKITVKVLLAAMLVHAAHAALENGEVALG